MFYPGFSRAEQNVCTGLALNDTNLNIGDKRVPSDRTLSDTHYVLCQNEERGLKWKLKNFSPLRWNP
jgi:hypothetical protein